MQEREKPLGIGDVARLAGVSTGTVSRALNGRPEIARATRDRILQIVEQTGYVPSPSARSLVGSRAGVIEVVISEVLDDYVGQIILGIGTTLRPTEFGLMLRLHAFDEAHERGYVNRLNRRTADGVILVTPRHVGDELARLAARRFPAVVIGHRRGEPKLPSVSALEYEGARQAMDHLLGLGHTRIAIITGNLSEHSGQERLRGYRDALAAADLPWREDDIAIGDYSAASATRAMRALLARDAPPPAVFVCSDLMALAALNAINEAGLSVPRDVSVIGFDNFAFTASSTPPLTTVQQPLAEMGRIAAEMLLNLIEGRPLRQEHVRLPTSLVVRSSCTSPASVLPVLA